MTSHVHTVPVDDLIEHLADRDGSCVCGPTVEPVKRDDGSIAWLWLHHSLDGREFSEPDYQGPPRGSDGSR